MATMKIFMELHVLHGGIERGLCTQTSASIGYTVKIMKGHEGSS